MKTISMPSTTRFYIGQRFKRFQPNGRPIEKAGIVTFTDQHIWYVAKGDKRLKRVRISTVNEYIERGLWKQYFGED